MKYTIMLITGILSASLLTGCDLLKTSDTNQLEHHEIDLPKVQTISFAKVTPNQTKIIGDWVGKCHYDEYADESYQAELLMHENLSYIYTEKIYPTYDCTGDYSEEQNKDVGAYKLGEKTKASDGKSAFDFETHSYQEGKRNDEYFMVRFTDSTLVFTDENIDNSQPNGETLQTRNNYFNPKPRIIFTKILPN